MLRSDLTFQNSWHIWMVRSWKVRKEALTLIWETKVCLFYGSTWSFVTGNNVSILQEVYRLLRIIIPQHNIGAFNTLCIQSELHKFSLVICFFSFFFLVNFYWHICYFSPTCFRFLFFRGCIALFLDSIEIPVTPNSTLIYNSAWNTPEI